MQEEIFGPILAGPDRRFLEVSIPCWLSGQNLWRCISSLRTAPASAAVMERCAYGGGCVNDTIIHLATSEMGFGGVGESGMGAYHGRAGFEAFSHRKSVVDKKTWMDLPMRYQPYNRGRYEKLLRLFLR